MWQLKSFGHCSRMKSRQLGNGSKRCSGENNKSRYSYLPSFYILRSPGPPVPETAPPRHSPEYSSAWKQQSLTSWEAMDLVPSVLGCEERCLVTMYYVINSVRYAVVGATSQGWKIPIFLSSLNPLSSVKIPNNNSIAFIPRFTNFQKLSILSFLFPYFLFLRNRHHKNVFPLPNSLLSNNIRGRRGRSS
jgi:hypothetical protein